MKYISNTELEKAQAILNKYGFHNSETVFFHADIYQYGQNKQGLKNLTKITHKDDVMLEPTTWKVSRRANAVFIKLEYVKVTDAIKEYVTSYVTNQTSIDVGSDHITCKWEFDSVEEATNAKAFASEGTQYTDALTNASHYRRTAVVDNDAPKPDEAPVVNIFIKLPKCSRVFKNYQAITSIQVVDLGSLSREVYELGHNVNTTATRLQYPLRYIVDGVTIPGSFVREVEYKHMATFDCSYTTDEFLRIEDNNIVLSRNNETILLSNDLMNLHGKCVEVCKHDDMIFLLEDTQYEHPISKQVLSSIAEEVCDA